MSTGICLLVYTDVLGEALQLIQRGSGCRKLESSIDQAVGSMLSPLASSEEDLGKLREAGGDLIILEGVPAGAGGTSESVRWRLMRPVAGC
eukprot:CAMPEP_0117075126 /NCGR_PEP_ID=MMETSP0472-20121206/52966_1 /TAXON_ID=693140 ORGANISM="Tiarina fusus, Strain LIS" /NCGR_SAMPLE_ID=MMETSP0472 /ASSEMBLY_ACC=CAM_ASM_000603 /LENGTH=90 /DNA_ID=CAMNT_0004800503 /DNA_START=177 /DNA_END=449 /DNA_ORIENTATION=+